MIRTLVLVGPSATGKTTVKDLMVASGQVRYGVTCTTRPPRPNEVDGRDYDFLTDDQWRVAEWNDELAEKTDYIGNPKTGKKPADYGIFRHRVAEAHAAEVPTLWILDTNGVTFIREEFANVLVVALTADPDTLWWRLTKRGDSAEDIEKRLARFDEELTLALKAADYVIDTTGHTPEWIAQYIAAKMAAQP